MSIAHNLIDQEVQICHALSKNSSTRILFLNLFRLQDKIKSSSELMDLSIFSSYEATTRHDTSRFDSFISDSISYIEIVKSLKEFLPMAVPSKFMAVLLNFTPISRYLLKKSN